MTAVPHWDIVGPADTDADLARAAAAGDRAAFAGIYDRYADRLHDFCVGMLRDRDDAADCVQDVFCTAATRLGQLREPTSCARGCMRSPATKRCVASGTAAAKPSPTNCLKPCLMNLARKPWPHAPNSPI